MPKSKPLIDAKGEVRKLTAGDMKRLRPAKEVLPGTLLARLKARGPQKAPTKERGGRAAKVRVSASKLLIALTAGRTVTVPLQWYPRLVHGTASQRRSWRLIGRGAGIHWPALDEDISVDDLLAGRPSDESKASLQRWLGTREKSVPRSRRPPARSTSPRAARG